jgi:hypothetical protein
VGVVGYIPCCTRSTSVPRAFDPEEILTRSARPRPLLAVLACVAAMAACDRLPDAVIVAEFDLTFSFESGLTGWTSATADLGAGTGSIAESQSEASAGSRSATLVLNNSSGAGKVWMTHELEVTPDQSYSVDISFDLATTDHGTTEPWKIIVGLRQEAPTGPSELDFQGDTSSGLETAAGAVWTKKTFTVAAKADDEGRLFLSLGVWGTTAGARAYHLDNVRVVLTRS